jgi:hypothetical protein
MITDDGHILYRGYTLCFSAGLPAIDVWYGPKWVENVIKPTVSEALVQARDDIDAWHDAN